MLAVPRVREELLHVSYVAVCIMAQSVTNATQMHVSFPDRLNATSMGAAKPYYQDQIGEYGVRA